MQALSPVVIDFGMFRSFGRGLTLLLFLCISQLAIAQQTVATSPSVVLVLKLVSNTHVKPTTGIVISDNGLVLVSTDFVSSEGELIVLDGGTDILTHGRPATVLEEAASGKLAIIAVEGLKRPGITLSNNTLNAESALFLEAFPPAENIAKGDQPLRVPIEILSDEQGVDISVSPETPLPYVSGAIIDHCGYLTGISLSSGSQSLETAKAPVIMFSRELARALDELKVTTTAASCTELEAQSEITDPATNSPDGAQLIARATEQKPQTVETETIEPLTSDPVATEVKELPSDGVVVEPQPQVSPVVTEPPSIWRSVPLWLPLLAIVVLGVFAWKAIFFFRLNKSEPDSKTSAGIARNVQPASDEPVTAPLETGADINVVKPRAAPVVDFAIPAWDKRPEGCDGVLLIEGLLDAKTDFKRFCFVNTQEINIIIGRGDSDISIEHAAISRSHVRIESNGDWMTLSDLGSRNGTFIGDVPCLPGETMYIDTGDEIFLGDVKLTVSLVKQEAEWA
jgi:hypothetical protein